jgi:hypothetical protein
MPKKGNYESKVVPNFALIRAWKRDNISDEEICSRIGIKKSAYYEYKKKHQEFRELLRFDKELTDAEVENQALDNAKGYFYEEEQVIMAKETIFDEETGRKIKEISTPKVVLVRKRKLSDQQATQWWLKNRLPGKWKDKQEIDVGNTDGRPFKLEDVL